MLIILRCDAFFFTFCDFKVFFFKEVSPPWVLDKFQSALKSQIWSKASKFNIDGKQRNHKTL